MEQNIHSDTQPFPLEGTGGPFEKLRNYINDPKRSRLVSLLSLLLLAITLPVAMYVVQQNQDLRQFAQTPITAPATPTPTPPAFATPTPSIPCGVNCPTPTQSVFPTKSPTPTIGTSSVTYNLTSGWNTIGISVSYQMGSGQFLSLTRNACVMIVGFNQATQQPQFYTTVPNLGIPNDLAMVTSGKGYLIYCTSPTSFTLRSLSLASYPLLFPHFQIIAIPANKDGILASKFLDEIATAQPTRNCQAVGMYGEGGETIDLSTQYFKGSTDQSTNFTMSNKKAYVVYCE